MLEILSVNDPAFAEYGAVWTDVGAALTAAIARALEEETPLPTATDYVPEDPAIQNLDTSRVKAFRVLAGQLVEVYTTTLHYAPCNADEKGFKALVALLRQLAPGEPRYPRGLRGRHLRRPF